MILMRYLRNNYNTLLLRPVLNVSRCLTFSCCKYYCANEETNCGNFNSNSDEKTVSFAKLLRHSKFMQLGDINGRTVVGKIYHIVNDDLYVDFGGKFHCVCKRPMQNAERFKRGAAVLLRLHDFELSSRFLGSEKDLTLLEADATLLGLYDPDLKTV